VEAFHSRVEQLEKQADLVVTRAVAVLPKLYAWTKGLVRSSGPGNFRGIIALKGGDLQKEVSPFGNQVELRPVSDYFEEEFFSAKLIVYLNF
jgi:16S rRNA (guanine527-N7)-methyltransferase